MSDTESDHELDPWVSLYDTLERSRFLGPQATIPTIRRMTLRWVRKSRALQRFVSFRALPQRRGGKNTTPVFRRSTAEQVATELMVVYRTAKHQWTADRRQTAMDAFLRSARDQLPPSQAPRRIGRTEREKNGSPAKVGGRRPHPRVLPLSLEQKLDRLFSAPATPAATEAWHIVQDKIKAIKVPVMGVDLRHLD